MVAAGRIGARRYSRPAIDDPVLEPCRSATIEVEQAWRRVSVAEAALDVAPQGQRLAAKGDRLTQTAYRAGQGTSLELVIVASALRQAEINLALRELDVVRARLEALFAPAHCSGST